MEDFKEANGFDDLNEFQDDLELSDSGEDTAERITGRETYEWARSLVAAVLTITLLFTFAVRMMGVSGGSMIPTLQDGDRLVVINSTLCRDYEIGDIVIARKMSFDDKPIIKRVIAKEGQTVDIDFDLGKVYVDSVELEEDYINDLTYLEEGTELPVTLGENELFVMGDNRNHSNDSRDYRLGPVDERLIIGKAVFILFPGKDYLTEKRDMSRIGRLK